jgi:hypothetical protein
MTFTVGKLNIVTDQNGVSVKGKSSVIHPNYSKSAQNVNYDIAIVKLASYIPQGTNIQYIGKKNL